jgi:hypothetical protein
MEIMEDDKRKEKKFENYMEFGGRFYGCFYSRKGLKRWRRDMFREFPLILNFGKNPKNPTDLKRVAACVMHHVAQLRVQLRAAEDELKEKGVHVPLKGTQEFIEFRTSCLPIQGSIKMLSDEIKDMEDLARSYLPLSLERK